jgi:hypothetical protein
MVSGNLKAKSSVRSGIGGDFQLDFAPTELVLFCVSNYKDLASTEPAMASAESRPKPNHARSPITFFDSLLGLACAATCPT